MPNFYGSSGWPGSILVAKTNNFRVGRIRVKRYSYFTVMWNKIALYTLFCHFSRLKSVRMQIDFDFTFDLSKKWAWFIVQMHSNYSSRRTVFVIKFLRIWRPFYQRSATCPQNSKLCSIYDKARKIKIYFLNTNIDVYRSI